MIQAKVHVDSESGQEQMPREQSKDRILYGDSLVY